MRQASGQALGIWLALLFGSGTVLAKAELEVHVGWNGAYRAGRWTAVYVTAWDTTAAPAKAVKLEILSPHDPSSSLKIEQQLTIGRDPQTFLVYLPLTYELTDTVAVLRQGMRKLAELPFDRISTAREAPPGYSVYSTPKDLLIGCSGQSGKLGLPTGSFSWTEGVQPKLKNQSDNTDQLTLRVESLPAKLLPDAWVGYDGLDILALNAPDLVRMPQEQQVAIAQWVRGGGRLLIWPGDGLIPADSAIAQLLPCSIGSSEAVELSLADTKAIGVLSRVQKVPARRLEGMATAKKVEWLDGRITVLIGRSGFGQVAVLPIDTGQLAFEGDKSADFWRPLLREMMKPQPAPKNAPDYYGSRYPRTEEQLRSGAMQVVVDRLGDVPGVGRFDFSYIAIVLAAMMIVVGPVDWLVLKKLGRQPWTWATISGWIGLVTVGAIYIGHIVHSGDLHYRTVRLVDQADGAVAGVLDVMTIYSPRTQSYALEMARESWCLPADISSAYGYSQPRYRAGSEVVLAEDGHGLRPAPMTINIWNLRFMQAELGDVRGEKPLIRAKLKRNEVMRIPHVMGTITNLGDARLDHVMIRAGSDTSLRKDRPAKSPADPPRLAMIPAIEPGQTVNVDAVLQLQDVRFAPTEKTPMQPYDSESWYRQGAQDLQFLRATCGLAPDRSRRIETLLAERADLACIYAESEVRAPAVKLGEAGVVPIEKHWQVIRALVELKEEQQ